MVISDNQSLGSLFRKKKKQPAPKGPPPSTNYHFPPPTLPGSPDVIAQNAGNPDSSGVVVVDTPAGPVKMAVKPAAMAPLPMAPTIAPFEGGGFQQYLPWIVGGAVVLLGGGLIYLKLRE
jgi:hypothetical protein